MRKHLRALAALTILAASFAVGSPSATGIEDPTDVTAGLVDVRSSIASLPTTVSPPGEAALFAVTVENVGILTTDATVLVDLVDGAVYRDELSSPECEASGADVVCNAGTLAPATSKTFDVVANTGLVAGSQVTAATAQAVGVVEPLEYRNNNTSSVTTEVLPASTEYRAGLVEQGDSMELVIADGRRYVLRVPQGVPGVIVKQLAPSAAGTKKCGIYGCRDGFILDFVPHPHYKAEDPLNPLLTNRTFGPQPPCQGLGNETCSSIYYAKSDAEQLLTLMPNCAGASGGTAGTGIAIPSPCINQKYKVNGLIWFDVRLLSNDPVELPPVLLG